jgi:Zn-dependent peptidase ImmA (M78 family)/transcriptional regulator with XRE-family HTH domain
VADLNPALLTLIREYRGYSQAELARRSGFTQGYISKVESNVIVPSDEAVAKLAATLEWPVAFFARTDRVYGFGTACMYHRKRASVSVGTLRAVQAMINVVRMSLVPLIREITFEAENSFPVLDIDNFGGDAERVAQLVRGGWRLPLGPIANLVEALESAGGIVYRVDFGTRLLDAVSHWAPDMPPLFFVNTEAPGDRVRFSLAHELGHVIMHSAPTSAMEQDANRFAGEFLMPAAEIRGSLIGIDLAKAAQLKPYWKVSMAALILRARDLGCINAKRASWLFMQMSSLGYRSTEPMPIATEEPSLARRILDIQSRVHGYTLEQLVKMAGMPEDDFRNHHLSARPVLRALR